VDFCGEDCLLHKEDEDNFIFHGIEERIYIYKEDCDRGGFALLSILFQSSRNHWDVF
jgi:hypothetical protein